MTTLQFDSAGHTELAYLAKTLRRHDHSRARRMASLGVIIGAVLMTAACSHAMAMMHGTGAKRPAITEFGLGPRTSATGLYSATLEVGSRLQVRRLQAVRVSIADRNGRAVEGATLTIDGGMPQHGHGLPTRPRMTRTVTEGTYEIEGVRFNMGGWWEFKVTIASERGTDTVTFNLSL